MYAYQRLARLCTKHSKMIESGLPGYCQHQLSTSPPAHLTNFPPFTTWLSNCPLLQHGLYLRALHSSAVELWKWTLPDLHVFQLCKHGFATMPVTLCSLG